MSVVWKFPVAMDDETTVTMPAGAQPLRVDEEARGGAALWAFVPDPSAQPAPVVVRIAGTGHPVGRGISHSDYLNTFFTHRRALVWHAFIVPTS